MIFSAEERAVVYARPPFTADSDALSVKLNSDGYPPEALRETLRKRELQPFLDADDVRRILGAKHDVEISEEQLVDLVLYYAENREYPQWFYGLEAKE